jgi:hypothetical protein
MKLNFNNYGFIKENLYKEGTWESESWRQLFVNFHENPTFENAVAIYDHPTKKAWGGQDEDILFTWIKDPSQELITYIRLREA